MNDYRNLDINALIAQLIRAAPTASQPLLGEFCELCAELQRRDARLKVLERENLDFSCKVAPDPKPGDCWFAPPIPTAVAGEMFRKYSEHPGVLHGIVQHELLCELGSPQRPRWRNRIHRVGTLEAMHRVSTLEALLNTIMLPSDDQAKTEDFFICQLPDRDGARLVPLYRWAITAGWSPVTAGDVP